MKLIKQRKIPLIVAGILLCCFIVITRSFAPFYPLQNAFALGNVADKIIEGRNYLVAHDLENANNCFKQAVNQDSTHPEANFFYSVTRILVLTHSPEFISLLNRFGVLGEMDIYNWTAEFQRDAEDNIILPDNSPTTGEVIDFLKNTVLPEIEGALSNLANIDSTINLLLTPAETSSDQNLEVDYGDIALYKSILHYLKSIILIIDAYDLDVDLDEIVVKIKEDIFRFDTDILLAYSNFLNLKTSHLLGQAKNAFMDSINCYIEASEFIRNEKDFQYDDLVTIDPEDLEDEKNFRNLLATISESLYGPKQIPLEDPFILDLTQFFDDPINLRDYIPLFDEYGNPIPSSFPDPTFSGVFPGFNQSDLTKLFGLTPSAPTLNVIVSGTTVTLSWNSVTGADGYILFYAPPDISFIGDIDVGNQTGPFEVDLWSGAAFYVAVKAYNSAGNSDYSNIEFFTIP